jgi:dihydrofolate reductase
VERAGVRPHPSAADEAGPDTAFLSCDVKEAVGTAVDAAAGRDVVLLGAHIARQCVVAGLVDELLVHVTPTLLGDGVRLFSRPGPAVELEMINQTRSGDIVDLRFRLPG